MIKIIFVVLSVVLIVNARPQGPGEQPDPVNGLFKGLFLGVFLIDFFLLLGIDLVFGHFEIGILLYHKF